MNKAVPHGILLYKFAAEHHRETAYDVPADQVVADDAPGDRSDVLNLIAKVTDGVVGAA